MTENIALYRKYRPQTFAEIIGQEPIVKILTRAVANKTVAHAYLFIGSRGTGKTSVARILAKAIGTKPEDLYEIDGASNRGIDEIRALRDAVSTLPFASPQKVYLIDEVHMLTKEAFNALLKTLEEPPRHVVFILATTEGHKVPETIISRCQSFVFRKPGIKELQEVIERVMKKEGWQIDGSAVELLALLGDGSYRDALGILQKVVDTSTDKKVDAEEVAFLTGAPPALLVRQFIEAVVDGQAAAGLQILNQAASNNQDSKIFLKLVLRQIRLALFCKLAPEVAREMLARASAEEVAFLEKLSARADVKHLPKILKELLVTYDDLGHSFLPFTPLELAILRLTT